MAKNTTVQMDKDVADSLKKLKEHPRQTYNELIKSMIEVFKKNKRESQYDEFLHSIQQEKMRELWGNDDDEAWERV